LAIRDVETCRLGQRVGDIASDLCVVVTDAGVILGDLRGDSLHAAPETRVEEVMDPAPSTYRPNTSVHEMAHQLAESDATRVLVSDGDGRLIGLLRREDVERTLAEKT
jgi:CBS domain-containing protein